MSVKGQGHVCGPDLPGLLRALRQLHQFESDLCNSSMGQADVSSHAIGYINFASLLIRAAVINTYYFKFSVPRVYHPHDRSKREVRVGSSKGLGVELFAICRLLAIKSVPVPPGVPFPSLKGLNGFI